MLAQSDKKATEQRFESLHEAKLSQKSCHSSDQ